MDAAGPHVFFHLYFKFCLYFVAVFAQRQTTDAQKCVAHLRTWHYWGERKPLYNDASSRLHTRFSINPLIICTLFSFSPFWLQGTSQSNNNKKKLERAERVKTYSRVLFSCVVVGLLGWENAGEFSSAASHLFPFFTYSSLRLLFPFGRLLSLFVVRLISVRMYNSSSRITALLLCVSSSHRQQMTGR